MKKLKISAIVFVFSLGFSPFSFAAEESQIVKGVASGTSGKAIPEVGAFAGQKTDEIATGVRDVVFDSAYEKSGQEAKQILGQLEGAVNSANSSVGGLSQAVQLLGQAANSCKKYTEVGVDCCKNPVNCGGSEEGAAGQADQAAGQTAEQAEQAMGAAGGGGAAAQCLSALPGLMAMTGKSKGAGQACGLIRDGDGGGRRGCIKTCEDVGSAANRIASAAASLADRFPEQVNAINNLKDQAKEHHKTAGKSAQQCSSETKGGQVAAAAQAGGGSNAIQGLMGCLQALMAGEETQEENAAEQAKLAVNCASVSERAASPDQCIGYSGDFGGDGNLSKTSGSNFATDGEPSSDLPDDPMGAERVLGTPAGAAVGAAALKTTNPVAAMLGGTGTDDASSKTGSRRGKAGKDLISGYKNVKGGSGSRGGRRGLASKSFKPFSFGKKKKKKDLKALAALSQLMKAGISPDQSGSIFERASKRFVSSSAKEKLFDAKRNRRTWMEEIK